jgi:glutamyl-tRNA synthetase
MADSDVRVRFAPSPTGYLHVGGARTALFNWLFARKVGGKSLLRVEDTDRARSSEEHTKVILDGLEWLGLDWDEEVVFQADGLERHQLLADRLIESEHAYSDEGAVRFRMPDETISWEDAVHGFISFEGADIKDWVILRSDRTPTYNFSVVADDIEMGLTHVIRGDDHISNTPKQIAVYRALSVAPPIFGHVPVIHGMDGRKLSKRHGAKAVGDYRHDGILPGALRNFLALLGWSSGDDRELFFATDELVEVFSLEGIQKKSAIFDPQKLEWMNGQHMTQTPPEDLLTLIAPALTGTYHIDPPDGAQDQILRSIAATRSRARTTHELAQRVAVRLDASFIEREEKAIKTIQKDPAGFRTALHDVAAHLTELGADAWESATLEAELRGLAEAMGVGLGKVMQPVRIALTGCAVSEPVNELLWVVGKEESLRRIEAAQAWPEAQTN